MSYVESGTFSTIIRLTRGSTWEDGEGEGEREREREKERERKTELITGMYSSENTFDIRLPLLPGG
jgi:hypothetical protein